MSFRIRVADPVNDYPEVARLRSLVETPPIAADDLRALDADCRSSDFVLRVVADDEGRVVATGHAVNNVWHAPGAFRLGAIVDPPHRRRGYGSKLLDYLEHTASKNGATEYHLRVADRDPESAVFVERRGYSRVAHTYESVLDLSTYDPSRFHVTPRIEAQMFTFGSTPMDEQAERLLWDLNAETSLDEPHHDEGYRPSFEEFRASVIQASWFDPHGQFIATVEGEWVGLCAIARFHTKGFSNLFTGIRRECRGKGLAKWLKVAGTNFAQMSGAAELRTNNDSRNAPMIAVNRWLGYQAEPGWFNYRKDT